MVLLFWLFCGFMLLSLVLTVAKDETAVQVKVRESLQDSMQRRRSVSGVEASFQANTTAYSSNTTAVHNPLSVSMPSDGAAMRGPLLKYSVAESAKLTILPSMRHSSSSGDISNRRKTEEKTAADSSYSPLYQAFRES